MKKYQKIIVSIVFLMFIGTGFAFTLERTVPVDTRAQALGNAMLTDSESVYTLFNNPAALPFVGKMGLVTIAPVNVGGDLEGMFEVAKLGMNGGDLVGALPGLLGPTGFDINAQLGGPLTFGGVNKNFGWGLLNNITINGTIPSTTKSDIYANVGTDLYFGYGLPLSFGKIITLSVGFSGRFITNVGVSYTDSITNLFDQTNTLSLPSSLGLGFGMDLGVQVKLLNFINVALAWKDFYSPVWTRTYATLSDFGKTKNDFEYDTIKSSLPIAVGFDFPLQKVTNNLISHFGVIAQYDDALAYVTGEDDVFNPRNPWLDLSAGVELVLWDVLALRVGMSEMYPAGGLGLYIGGFRIDYSIYAKELGNEPGDDPQLNMGLALSVQW